MKSRTLAAVVSFWLVCPAGRLLASVAEGGEAHAHSAGTAPSAHAAKPGAPVPVKEATKDEAAPAPDPGVQLREEHASLLRIGAAKLDAGDGALALIAFRQVAAAPLDDQESAEALMGLARAYRASGQGVKAVATYEHFIAELPNSTEVPMALLELGRTLRDLGSTRLAMARFYSVIHSTLRLPEGEADRYKSIVRTAQFEIAETHLATGAYAEAAKFFSRLDLLDLAPEDRSRARFKAAQARALSSDDNTASAALSAFIEENPDDIHSPEARFMLANLLYRMGRLNESLQVTLHLLNHEKARGDTTGTWRSWQRRTGNLLANQFYEQGEFFSALQLYRSLDGLGDTAEWRVPVLYQLALCQERLQQNNEALRTYASINDLVGKNPLPAFSDIVRMVQWRIGQLQWAATTRVAVNALRSDVHNSETLATP